jgi:hypothetical protein
VVKRSVVGGGMGRSPSAALVIAAYIFMSSFTLPGIMFHKVYYRLADTFCEKVHL